MIKSSMVLKTGSPTFELYFIVSFLVRDLPRPVLEAIESERAFDLAGIGSLLGS